MPRPGESVALMSGGGSRARGIGAAVARAMVAAGAAMAFSDFAAAHYYAATLLAEDAATRQGPAKPATPDGTPGNR